MPQNVLVSVLGEGKYLTALVRAILEKNIIPTRFLFLSAKNEASLQAAEGYDVTVCEDELSAVIKSEIVLVTASRREMPTGAREDLEQLAEKGCRIRVRQRQGRSGIPQRAHRCRDRADGRCSASR